MKFEVFADVAAVARQAATLIAADARSAVASRGRFSMAVSGGKTPWLMLRPWPMNSCPGIALNIFQVDERIAPAGDPDRNLTHHPAKPPHLAPLKPEQMHAMPVNVPDLAEAAKQYAGNSTKVPVRRRCWIWCIWA